LKEALPDLAIGTVDKFQGQEAAVVICSMATSTAQDAPRGMEFLYGPNRFNVAVSRAKVRFILVGNDAVMTPVCRMVAEMRLANSFCGFLGRGVD
jgi:superfamily I DNA and/or RNA helicase